MSKKLELDTESVGKIEPGDYVTVRRLSADVRGENAGPYATIHRTSQQSFSANNGALDHYVGDATVQRVINDGRAVVIGRMPA